jgi:gliding motility-associated-like protein
MIEVLPGLTWVDGGTEAFTVDCGLSTTVYSYHWDNDPTLTDYASANPIATVPGTTYYVVGVVDPNTGCTITDSIQITTTTPVTAEISGTEIVCEGDTENLIITFTGSGPYDFEYTDPNSQLITVTNITFNPYSLPVSLNGNYTLNSVIGNGCDGTIVTTGPDGGVGTLQVIIPPEVTIATSASYCEGDALNDLTVTSTNGGTVFWFNNAGLTGIPLGNGNTFSPNTLTTSVTTYYAQEVETVSGLNCPGSSDNVTITINAIPNAPLVSGNTIYCEGDMATPLSAEMSLGGNANWYDNSNLTPPTISTQLQYTPTLNVGTNCYYVNETAAGCTGDSTEICVVTKPTPTAPIITGNTTYCEGDTPTPLTATATIGGNITWFNAIFNSIGNGATYTPNLASGDQTFSASETLNGCTGPSQTVSITVNVLPIVDLPTKIEICKGDSVEITATHNNFDLLWSNGATTETTWITTDTTSTHYITATNPLCGMVIDSVFIIVNSLPYVNAGNDTVIGIGGEATLWAWSQDVESYEWTPSVNECITANCSEVYVIPNQATLYIVEVIDDNSCHNYDTVLVDISGLMEVFVPNIFSPNGDGINDYLVINGPRLFDFNIEIFDRWGKLIYVTQDQKEYWDGKFNGAELATQTFVYTIKGETVLGEKIVRSGNVTIIK